MKKIIVSLALVAGIVTTSFATPPDVNERILKSFKETFTKAQDVVWHEYEDYCQANFTQDDIQVRAQYDESGNLLKTIRYYGEKQLLPNIVSRLRAKYSDREIFGVTETTSPDEVTFFITLRDNKNYYVLRSDAFGNFEQTEKFKRADN